MHVDDDKIMCTPENKIKIGRATAACAIQYSFRRGACKSIWLHLLKFFIIPLYSVHSIYIAFAWFVFLPSIYSVIPSLHSHRFRFIRCSAVHRAHCQFIYLSVLDFVSRALRGGFFHMNCWQFSVLEEPEKVSGGSNIAMSQSPESG